MKLGIKPLMKRVLPQRFANTLRSLSWNLHEGLEKRRTQRALAAASVVPLSLDIGVLETLQIKYPPLPEYGYDAHALELRGIERATQILNLPGAQEADSFLELGCWDGMTSWGLCQKGKKATAIDYKDEGFDERASSGGVNLLQMDAADLRFADESFDFVFSYNTFEHFASPEDVLREAIRVLRKGGYIYLEFGPLYFSPYGAHAYRSIPVPYCQFLFEKSVMNEFTARRGLKPIDFDQVNGWSLASFRELWSKHSHLLKRLSYKEQLDLSHLSLIRTYPACFKSRSNYFDNFIVAGISVLFQKTSHELPRAEMNSDWKM